MVPISSLIVVGVFLLGAGGLQLLTRRVWARSASSVLRAWGMRSAAGSTKPSTDLESRVLAIGTIMMLSFVGSGCVLLLLAVIWSWG